MKHDTLDHEIVTRFRGHKISFKIWRSFVMLHKADN